MIYFIESILKMCEKNKQEHTVWIKNSNKVIKIEIHNKQV